MTNETRPRALLSGRLADARRLAVLTALIFATACSDDSSSSSTAPSLIGPDGGTLALGSGVTLMIPAGALAQPTQISVTLDASGAGVSDDRRVGPVLAFSPANLEFAVPVQLVFEAGSGVGDVGRLLVLTLEGGQRVALRGASLGAGGTLRTPLQRLAPIWLSDRAGLATSLDVGVGRLVMRSGEQIRLRIEARNLAGTVLTGQGDDGLSLTSGDAAVAAVTTVDGAATVSALRVGQTTITAARDGLQATIAVDVTGGPLARLEVRPTTLEVPRRDSVTLAVDGFDAAGNAVEVPLVGPAGLRWSSSDAGVARVGVTGVVFGAGSGAAVVTATANGASASADVTVPAPNPTALRIVSRQPVIAVDASVTLRVSTFDEFGEVIAGDDVPAVDWAIRNADVAKVVSAAAAQVTLRGVASGETWLVARSSAGADSVEVVVEYDQPWGLALVDVPTGGYPAQPFSATPRVQLIDETGIAFAQAGVTVTATAITSPAGATLRGETTAITDDEGIATFDDLSAGRDGTWRLEFSAPGLESVAMVSTFEISPAFVMIFDVTAGTTIRLPFDTHDITVDWGDGTTGDYKATSVTHTYSSSGTKLVIVTGSASSLGDAWNGAETLVEVVSWSGLGLESLNGAFYGAANLIAVPADALPPGVKDVRGMFAETQKFNQDVSAWDMSNVTWLDRMFQGAVAFNNGGVALDWGGIGTEATYDVRMESMFERTKAFNQDISAWDVSHVTRLARMFRDTEAFNNGGVALDWGGIGTAATVEAEMQSMFERAKAFNQDISDWDVSRVTRFDGMFKDAEVFNNGGVALDWGGIGTAATRSIAMVYMFERTKAFNQDISDWDVSNVTDFAGMFKDAEVFNNGGVSLDWGGIGTAAPIDVEMQYMFERTQAFNQDISAWNVSRVTRLDGMFKDAETFNNGGVALDWGGIGTAATRDVELAYMFERAKAFNQDISDWDVSHVKRFEGMFKDNLVFNNGGVALDWGGIGTSATGTIKLEYMFERTKVFDQSLNAWDVSNVSQFKGMFSGAEAFNQDLDAWDVSYALNFSYMFRNAAAFDRDISMWCVPLIVVVPQDFATNSLASWTTDEKPVWGTCGGVPAGSTVTSTGGDALAADIGSRVAIPPAVTVLDGSGDPVAGVTVRFEVTEGGGTIAPAAIANITSTYADGGTLLTTTDQKAEVFTTPDNETVLESVTILLNSFDASYPSTAALTVAIHAMSAGVPSTALWQSPLITRVLSESKTWLTVDLATPLTLAPNTDYAFVVTSPTTDSFKWGNARPAGIGASGLGGFVAKTALVSEDVGITWASAGSWNNALVLTLSNSGSPSTISVKTDAQGRAMLGGWTLGSAAISNKVTATVVGLDGDPVVITATGTISAGSRAR